MILNCMKHASVHGAKNTESAKTYVNYLKYFWPKIRNFIESITMNKEKKPIIQDLSLHWNTMDPTTPGTSKEPTQTTNNIDIFTKSEIFNSYYCRNQYIISSCVKIPWSYNQYSTRIEANTTFHFALKQHGTNNTMNHLKLIETINNIDFCRKIRLLIKTNKQCWHEVET